MGILVAGAVFVDIKGFPEGAYIPDGRNAGRIEYRHGGVSRNVVEDLAHLGFRPVFLSMVEDSAMGQDVLEHLKACQVNTDYVMLREKGMGKWLAVFDEKGDLAGSISERADMSPLAEMLDEKGEEIFRDIDTVCIQADLPAAVLERLFALAERQGARKYAVIANMSIAAEQRDFLKRYDCLVCNQIEAGQFFREDYTELSAEELCGILSHHIDSGQIASMVVTMGDQGCVYASSDGESGCCPAEQVKVVDTTGAGDAFFAGMAAGLASGSSLAQAVRIAGRVAATVVASSENVCPVQEFHL